MTGVTVVVTGATSGIGLATATGLADRGAGVALVGRSAERVATAVRGIRATGGIAIGFVADLSSQAEVRSLAVQLRTRLEDIDVLINNVGGFWNTRQRTSDGLERTFAVNHLAPFLLTNLLVDRIARSPHGRVVTVASHAHAHGRIDFEDLQGERTYSGARAYNQSKLANVLFSHELARRLRATAVAVNAVHPGLVNTRFGAEDPSRTQRVLVPMLRPLLKAAVQGAASSIRVASAPELQDVTGRYFAHGQPKPSSRRSRDPALGARLWQVSADLVGLPATLQPTGRPGT